MKRSRRGEEFSRVRQCASWLAVCSAWPTWTWLNSLREEITLESFLPLHCTTLFIFKFVQSSNNPFYYRVYDQENKNTWELVIRGPQGFASDHRRCTVSVALAWPLCGVLFLWGVRPETVDSDPTRQARCTSLGYHVAASFSALGPRGSMAVTALLSCSCA